MPIHHRRGGIANGRVLLAIVSCLVAAIAAIAVAVHLLRQPPAAPTRAAGVSWDEGTAAADRGKHAPAQPAADPAAAADSAAADSTATDSTVTDGAAHAAAAAPAGQEAAAAVVDAAATPSQGDPDCHCIVDDSLTGMEGFAAVSDEQLKKLQKLITHPADIDAAHAAALVSARFRCATLRPEPLQEVFRDRRIAVHRADGGGPAPAAAGASGASGEAGGPAALVAALQGLVRPYRDAGEIQVKFKTFRVENQQDSILTRVYFQAAGKSADQTVEQSSVWSLRWIVTATDQPPLLVGVEVADFEEVTTLAGLPALYADCTLAVLGQTDAYRDQLQYGIEHWRSRMPRRVEVDFRGHHGMAVGDVDGDGLEDVYLCQPNGLPDRLLLQNQDGTVRDVSAEAGIDWLDATKSVLLIDLDNDGDQDLVISTKHRVLVMSNDGRARFRVEAELEGPRRPHSMTAADYDNDGDLDFFVCGFWKFDVYKADPLKAAFALPTPWHDANNGAPNFMYRNEGEFRFTDVTVACGLDENNTRFSHAAGWEDFDNDGDMDLYVANDFGRNNLYRNDGGKFVDVAAELGVQDQAAGMSVAWADYDKDGWMDLYVSNMFSSAGNRVSYHRKFQEKLGQDERGEFQRHARGNTLFKNSPDSGFRDNSEEAAVLLGRWAWSSNFLDANNDGWDDIFVANGFVTNEDTKDL